MALSTSRKERVFMLCAMYFAQGVPWGFMVTALVAFLSQEGISVADAGELTAVVLVPWTFKLVWAPLIDTVTIRSMGRRRPWIIGAEMMMAVSLLGLIMMGDLTENLGLLKWMFFLHNCFASLQDVATDALAVDILPHSEQGRTNGMMWGSKLVGKAVGAYVMAEAIAYWGLEAAVLIQFILLLLIMMLPIMMLERPGEKRFPWSRRQVSNDGEPDSDSAPSNVRSLRLVMSDLFRAFASVTTVAFFLFGLIHNLGWGIVEVSTKTLCTQELDWDFTDVSKLAAMAVTLEIVAALLGGYLADRFGRRLVMTIGVIGYGVLAITFGSCPGLWNTTWFTAGYLFLSPGILALGAVGFLSMGMRLAWTKSAATMFTIYMTVSNVGHVVGNWLVRLRDPTQLDLSYEVTFQIAGVLTLVPLLLLLVVKPEDVDRLKEAEKDEPE